MGQKIATSIEEVMERQNKDFSKYFLYMFMMKLIGPRIYKKIS